MTTKNSKMPKRKNGSSLWRSVAVLILLLPGFSACRVWMNDIHSQMNRTRVARVQRPVSTEEVQKALREAKKKGLCVSICGGRHAMGGQQFGKDCLQIDTGHMNRVLHLDRERGLVLVQAGITWPKLVDDLLRGQKGLADVWTIRQKQTGADRLTLGGALSANAHGRGLVFPPMISDVESFTLVNANAEVVKCSRNENAELFTLAIGGYGLFGVICEVELRLAPRQKLMRVAKYLLLRDFIPAVQEKIKEGCLYGDFQFSIDPASEHFLTEGVFACYKPVGDDQPVSQTPSQISAREWEKLIEYAHSDKKKAFEEYLKAYLRSSGRVFWSDSHQLSLYLDDYHEKLDRRLRSKVKGTEMITEVYVPRDDLVDFMESLQSDFREHNVNLIYGTIRLVEEDKESFLNWARKQYICIVMNLHVDHDEEGLEKARDDFRRIIDRAVEHGGCYFLTYHRFARKDQILACYPQFPEFLKLKKKYDPEERFQSEWYRHYKSMFAEN